MRYLVLACDYDGTLATKGVIDDATVAALKRFRESGRKLLIVTGRELPELIEICPHLGLFTRVVAENGALVYDPATGEETPLAPAPDEQFIAALQRAGVGPMSVGRVIVATWEPHETTVLETIRDLGLELNVIFNKGAVMVLPTGVNKATGLAAVLKSLGFSPHNVVAVGDAENDHALLASCEAGVAVSNAIDNLKQHADLVTVADHGPGVTELIDKILENDLAELDEKLKRHYLLLGRDLDGGEVRIAPYRQNVLIVGGSGSGKSTIAGALVERLIDAKYQVCIVDPEGDYEQFEGVVSVGKSNQPPTGDEVMKLLEPTSKSVALNLLGVVQRDRPTFFATIASRLHELRQRRGRPHWLLVDEAHHIWPRDDKGATPLSPQQLHTSVFVTLEPSLLPAAVLETIDLVLAVGNEPRALLESFAQATGRKTPRLGGDTPPGTTWMWSLRSKQGPVPIVVQPTRCERRRHLRKYASGELEPERSFYFRGPEQKLKLRAQNLAMFLQLADGVDDETWLHHLAAGDYSKWLSDEIKDVELAHQIRAFEADKPADPVETRRRVRELIEKNYQLGSSETSEGVSTS